MIVNDKYFSKISDANQNVTIYLPDDYRKNYSQKSYGQLYMFHGIGGDEREWTTHTDINKVHQELQEKGIINQYILIMPNCRIACSDEFTKDIFCKEFVAGFYEFESDLMHDLIPYIESKYKVDKRKKALFGYSMGAFNHTHLV